MNSIKERFQSLKENYTVANAINYVDFLDECRKSDVVDCFENTFVEPIKGTEFTKKFILINSFSQNELNMMKTTLESFLEKAERSFYENEAHLEAVKECLEIIDAKLECVEHISLVDLVLESFYLDDMEITCEGAQISDIAIKQIISKDIDDETKVKLASKLIEHLKTDSIPLNTVKGVNVIISTTAIVIYYALTVPIAVVGLLLPVPIIMVSNLINSGAKAGNIAIYKRVLDSEIKKIEAAQKSGKTTPDVETYRQNLLQARQMLDETKKVTLESTLMDLEESETVHEKINVLDSAIRENFVKFALSEEETVEESVEWFNNIVKLSNVKELVVKEQLTNKIVNMYKNNKKIEKLMGSAGNANNFKRLAKEMIDDASTKKELMKAVNIIKGEAMKAKHPMLLNPNIGTAMASVLEKEQSTEIVSWVNGPEFQRCVDRRMKYIGKYVKESYDGADFDEKMQLVVQEGMFFKNTNRGRDDKNRLSYLIHLKEKGISIEEFKSRFLPKLRQYVKRSCDAINSQLKPFKSLEADIVTFDRMKDAKDFEKTLLDFSSLKNGKDYVTKHHPVVDINDSNEDTHDFMKVCDKIVTSIIEPMKDSFTIKWGVGGLYIICTEWIYDAKTIDKEIKSLESKVGPIKESFEDDEFDDLEDQLDDIFNDLDEEDEFVVEGTKADNRRKKVNVTANKIKSKAHKLKDKAKNAGQAPKAALHQVNKAGKALDDAATNTVNKAKDTYRNDIREEIIEDKTRVKLFRIIRKGIGIGAATMVNPAVGAITALTSYALGKKVKEKERRRILHELNEELEIVNEKIDDARGDSNKEKKYQLMRIRNQLNRDIKRIQYRVKSDGKGV